jgi:hypothetical protein
VLSPAEVAEISTKSTMQIGDNAYYSIMVKTQDGRTITAGSAFDSSTLAEQVVALMAGAMSG